MSYKAISFDVGGTLLYPWFFDGSPEALVMGLAETAQLDPETWEELQAELNKQQEESNDE